MPIEADSVHFAQAGDRGFEGAGDGVIGAGGDRGEAAESGEEDLAAVGMAS